MANIKFSQDLLRGMAIYLGTSLGEIARDSQFPYSKPALYKFADGSLLISDRANEALNQFWDSRELNSEDLRNIYQLIDLISEGRRKEKEYQLKRYIDGGI